MTADSSESGGSNSERHSHFEEYSRSYSVTGQPQIEVMTEEFEANIRHRKGSKNFKNSTISKEQDDSDSDEMINSTGEKSRSLFCRSSECETVKLEDF